MAYRSSINGLKSKHTAVFLGHHSASDQRMTMNKQFMECRVAIKRRHIRPWGVILLLTDVANQDGFLLQAQATCPCRHLYRF